MSTLRGAGVADYEAIDPIVANSMACPAMPLCGLAIGEAERGLPAVNARLRSLMTKVRAPSGSPAWSRNPYALKRSNTQPSRPVVGGGWLSGGANKHGLQLGTWVACATGDISPLSAVVAS